MKSYEVHAWSARSVKRIAEAGAKRRGRDGRDRRSGPGGRIGEGVLAVASGEGEVSRAVEWGRARSCQKPATLVLSNAG